MINDLKFKTDLVSFLTNEFGFANVTIDSRKDYIHLRVGLYYDEIKPEELKLIKTRFNVRVLEVMIDDSDCGLLYWYKIKKGEK